MTQSKPLASLSPSLLARKGSARPAMRSQDLSDPVHPETGEDLGWNDMGVEPDRDGVPPVLIEREALASELEQRTLATTSVSLAAATRIGREAAAKTHGAKAAFTLRLDADRHLKLRLASAVTKTSSQQLVIQALDDFLRRLPEVDALVAQLPRAKPRKR